jgi:membrane fusion protein, multidrug efflux system
VARVTGFVDEVTVDRGSLVRKGDLLMRLAAPDLTAQVAEAQARARGLDAQVAESRAKADAADATLARLTAASATPGAVAGNEVVQAQKAADAAHALQLALDESARAARAAADAAAAMQAYLRITAPFDGTITSRLVHPGALVGPSAGPVLTLEQMDRLRLVVALPEADAGSVARGDHMPFTVPARPGESFDATVARLAGSIDPKTRTMSVECDVSNPRHELAAGMYAQVSWSLRRAKASLLVPPSSIVTTTERSFVIRVRDGRAEWVDVAKGAAAGDLIEVVGRLQAGDEVVRRGSDEIHDRAAIAVRRTAAK